MQTSAHTCTLNRVPWCKKGIGNVVQWEDRTNCTDQLPDQPLVCMVCMWTMLFTLIPPFHMFAPPWSCSFLTFGSSQTSHNFLCNPEIWIFLYSAFYLINTVRLLKYLQLIHHYFLSFILAQNCSRASMFSSSSNSCTERAKHDSQTSKNPEGLGAGDVVVCFYVFLMVLKNC